MSQPEAQSTITIKAVKAAHPELMSLLRKSAEPISFSIALLFASVPVATEADDKDNSIIKDIALAISHKDPDNPDGSILIKIENKSQTAIKIVPPPDIEGAISPDYYWYCNSYQFYLLSPDNNIRRFVSFSPQLPKVLEPRLPIIAEIKSGESVSVPFKIELPTILNRPEVYNLVDDPDGNGKIRVKAPTPPGMPDTHTFKGGSNDKIEFFGRYWQEPKPNNEKEGPKDVHQLTVEYNFSAYGNEFRERLTPLIHQKLISNPLHFPIQQQEMKQK